MSRSICEARLEYISEIKWLFKVQLKVQNEKGETFFEEGICWEEEQQEFGESSFGLICIKALLSIAAGMQRVKLHKAPQVSTRPPSLPLPFFAFFLLRIITQTANICGIDGFLEGRAVKYINI